MTRKVGYARVSTDGQNLGRQLAALHQEGCDPILQDKASGKSVRGRPGLDKAIKALMARRRAGVGRMGPGDQVHARRQMAQRILLHAVREPLPWAGETLPCGLYRPA
jgi:hypothetical protein